jgi:hypothetical protein
MFGGIMKKQLLIGLVLSASVMQAKAWGPVGHKATALVAEAYLSPQAKAAIKDLLEGQRLVDVSNWADSLRDRPEYEHTQQYHYQNTRKPMKTASGVNANSYRANLMELSPRERQNYRAGVVEAIAGSEKLLTDPKATRKDKQAALKFLVHFVGDLHQPLHTGEARKIGGNTVSLSWMGSETNLHKVWDSEIITDKVRTLKGYSYRDPSWTYAQWLLDQYREQAKSARSLGNVATWYQESLGYLGQAYDRSYINNQRQYEAEASKTIDERILLGGRRLGETLNQIFRQPEMRSFVTATSADIPDQAVIQFAEKILGALEKIISFKPRSGAY